MKLILLPFSNEVTSYSYKSSDVSLVVQFPVLIKIDPNEEILVMILVRGHVHNSCCYGNLRLQTLFSGPRIYTIVFCVRLNFVGVFLLRNFILCSVTCCSLKFTIII